MRKRPPPIRMMSRHEIAMPKTAISGAVRPMSQVRPASMTTRKMKASDRPIWRARRAFSSSSRDVRTEMKTRLSMPSTISSTVSVISAAHACGSARSASAFISALLGEPDGEEIGPDHHQTACDRGAGIEIAEDGDECEHGPQEQSGDICRPQPGDAHGMEELERHEGQSREHDDDDGGEWRPGLE